MRRVVLVMGWVAVWAVALAASQSSLLLRGVGGPVAVAGGTCGASTYLYTRTITIDKTKVPNTDQTDFPVLVSGTYTYLKTEGNGGKLKSGSGFDVNFYSDSTCATALKYERETWDASSGVVNYWVKVPSVTTATDTVIYLAYASTTVTTDQTDPTNVWNSGYVGVWHLKDGTTLSLTDSTTNGLTLTNTNTATASAGQIDGAVTLVAASSQKLSRADTGVLNPATTLTLEAWAKLGANGSAKGILGKWTGNGYMLYTPGTGFITIYLDSSICTTAGSVLGDNLWHHVAMTKSGTTGTLYVDGATTNGCSGTAPATLTGSANPFEVGDYANSGSNWDGAEDDVRLSNVARGPDWIATEFNNQSAPGSFYTVGSEVAH